MFISRPFASKVVQYYMHRSTALTMKITLKTKTSNENETTQKIFAKENHTVSVIFFCKDVQHCNFLFTTLKYVCYCYSRMLNPYSN